MAGSERDVDALREAGPMALGSRLRRLSDRLMAGVHEIYRASGVEFEPRWFPVFSYLAQYGPRSVGEVASALGWSHAAVSQTVRAMTAQGVLTAEKDEHDERRRVLALSEVGHTRLAALLPVWRQVETATREVLQAAGPDLLTALDGLEDALGREDLAARARRLTKAQVMSRVKISVMDLDRADERAAFANLNRRWRQALADLTEDEEALLTRPEVIQELGGAIWVARLPGTPGVVGTVAVHTRPGEPAELCCLAVAEAHRGHQIGRALLETALEWLRAQRAPSVTAFAHSELAAALALFRDHGFTVERQGVGPRNPWSDLELTLAIR